MDDEAVLCAMAIHEAWPSISVEEARNFYYSLGHVPISVGVIRIMAWVMERTGITPQVTSAIPLEPMAAPALPSPVVKPSTRYQRLLAASEEETLMEDRLLQLSRHYDNAVRYGWRLEKALKRIDATVQTGDLEAIREALVVAKALKPQGSFRRTLSWRPFFEGTSKKKRS